MPTTPISGIPYPSTSDADNVPADLQGFAEHIDDMLNLRFADAAERDSRLPSPTLGTDCWLNNPGVKQVYTSTGWTNVWSPSPEWAALPLASGIAAQSQPPQYILHNGVLWLEGTAKKSDDTAFSAATATVIGTLPTGYRPATYNRYVPIGTQWVNGASAASIEIATSGAISLRAGNSPEWVSLSCSLRLA